MFGSVNALPERTNGVSPPSVTVHLQALSSEQVKAAFFPFFSVSWDVVHSLNKVLNV